MGDCPKGALIIEEREAEAFDEEAVAEHLATQKEEQEPLVAAALAPWPEEFNRKKTTNVDDFTETPSELTQWPVQLPW